MNSPGEPRSLFDGAGLSDAQLRTLYARTAGPVAYVDESYRAPTQALGGNSFYLLAAVLVERDRIARTRSKLRDIAEVVKWHTSDEALTAEGRTKILKMTRYLSSSTMSVVAAQAKITPADKDAEHARRACFDTLLGDLCSRNQLDASGLVVLERRRDHGQRSTDSRTISALRRSGAIHRTLVVHPGSPSGESLLWAPDIVAWATRRLVANDDKTYVQPLAVAKTIRIIHVL